MVNKDIGCGPLWRTIFGEILDVKSKVNPINEAYGNQYLPCHIDLPYYTEPPPIYFFLCLKNECEVRLTYRNSSLKVLSSRPGKERKQWRRPRYLLSIMISLIGL